MPDEFHALTGEHLRLLDEQVPGLVSALLITGSIPLADYWPGHSDIDFVAVLDDEPNPDQLSILAGIHGALPSSPSYDGIYLTRKQLADLPGPLDSAPQIVAGEFRPAKPGGQLNPVTWLELSRHAIPVRGERPTVHTDRDHLRNWLLGNLASYWASWATGARAAWQGQPADRSIPGEVIMWGALGPGRLHHTLATDAVASKTASGYYTADRFPAWRDLCRRTVRFRAGAAERFTTVDGLATIDLVDAVVADAQSRWPRR